MMQKYTNWHKLAKTMKKYWNEIWQKNIPRFTSEAQYAVKKDENFV